MKDNYKVFDFEGIERMSGASNIEKLEVFELMLKKQYGEVEEWKNTSKKKKNTRIASS